MARHTKKVGVVGKYGTRYGASLRKQVKKIEISQHARYTCMFCGKTAMKRNAVGIWNCKACKKTVAGGAWSIRLKPFVSEQGSRLKLLVAVQRSVWFQFSPGNGNTMVELTFSGGVRQPV
ncbi:uncharacterized protein MONBRDRAFT_37079 [Monosiga brevicollis MX1]|uniref:Ribosomal protein L37a n=1 Tax=Monosiga brevicollis TaxID=81824 RepID=A9UZG4_MONBE|nr:uncharacterized protein MONBRDRAFT_37079 [Monosiga brevicollis MX1]EDQ89363.1 predicted protein [Monosiga brevicollis MX1]|eukprot:XP_001745939.1 hypothetical protein [Monosiga brevicollis MX1]